MTVNLKMSVASAHAQGKPGVPACQPSRTKGIPRLRVWTADSEGVPVERIFITNSGFHAFSRAIQPVEALGDNDG